MISIGSLGQRKLVLMQLGGIYPTDTSISLPRQTMLTSRRLAYHRSSIALCISTLPWPIEFSPHPHLLWFAISVLSACPLHAAGADSKGELKDYGLSFSTHSRWPIDPAPAKFAAAGVESLLWKTCSLPINWILDRALHQS